LARSAVPPPGFTVPFNVTVVEAKLLTALLTTVADAIGVKFRILPALVPEVFVATV
jgi:hypothetical protein